MAKVTSKKTKAKSKIPVKSSGKKPLLKTVKKIKPTVVWQANKISQIQQVLEPVAHRASRFGALGIASILLFFTVYSLFVPKNKFEQAKEKVLKNPNDLEAHLTLTEEFLANNQIQEAGKELIIIETLEKENLDQEIDQTKILGWSTKIDQLKNDWQEANPEELKKLITKWNEVVTETPTYRDGWIRLAYYSYKIGEKEQAKFALDKAIEIDPYFETAKELSEVID